MKMVIDRLPNTVTPTTSQPPGTDTSTRVPTDASSTPLPEVNFGGGVLPCHAIFAVDILWE